MLFVKCLSNVFLNLFDAQVQAFVCLFVRFSKKCLEYNYILISSVHVYIALLPQCIYEYLKIAPHMKLRVANSF